MRVHDDGQNVARKKVRFVTVTPKLFFRSFAAWMNNDLLMGSQPGDAVFNATRPLLDGFDMKALLRNVKDSFGSGVVSADDVLSCARNFLQRMFRLGYYASPPKVPRLPQFPHLQEANVRTGFIEHEQYDRLTAATSELWLRALLEMAHVYEPLNLCVCQVDLISRTIRLDPGTTRNRKGREVTMTNTIHALLSEYLRGKQGQDFVFTRPNGKPVRDFRKSWNEICVAAGVGRMLCRKCETPVTNKQCKCGARGRELRYDARRTAARNFRRAGVADSVIMKIGGWKTRSVFDRYNIISQADVVDVLAKLEKQKDEDARESKKAQAAPEFSHVSVMTRGVR
jgi:hypothetical protein